MLNLEGVQKDIILAPYTTYKIGGPADYFFIAKSKEDLVMAIKEAKKINLPYFVLGTGANILIDDKGFRGLVIKNEIKEIKFQENSVTASSGVTIEELINLTKEKSLSGLEHYAGIPSTVGGALWQNLHFLSPDRQSTLFIESVLESAEILDENNEIRLVNKEFFNFGYDYSVLHDKKIIVLEATFKLELKDVNLIENQIQANLSWRNAKQPQLIDFSSCGSVFKKIEGIGIGRIIDSLGLKGYTVGGAQISEKHANYIVNLGNAKAKDVLEIINFVKQKIKKLETGQNISLEISLVGEF